MKRYKYGMRLREYGIGCQPMDNCITAQYTDKRKCGYWSYVWYSEPLTDKEIIGYDLDYLGTEEKL